MMNEAGGRGIAESCEIEYLFPNTEHPVEFACELESFHIEQFGISV
jgi:hypothetical protein